MAFANLSGLWTDLKRLGELMCFFSNIVETFTPAREVAPFVAIFFFVRCLSICAGRSRTLKLLGFQHLHFDARLQAGIRWIH